MSEIVSVCTAFLLPICKKLGILTSLKMSGYNPNLVILSSTLKNRPERGLRKTNLANDMKSCWSYDHRI